MLHGLHVHSRRPALHRQAWLVHPGFASGRASSDVASMCTTKVLGVLYLHLHSDDHHELGILLHNLASDHKHLLHTSKTISVQRSGGRQRSSNQVRRVTSTLLTLSTAPGIGLATCEASDLSAMGPEKDTSPSASCTSTWHTRTSVQQHG